MGAQVLGLSAYFHDASAALIVDGTLVAAAAEERFSRIKHDPNLPVESARFCLRQAGLKAGDLDAIVFYEEPHIKFTRVLTSVLTAFPYSRRSFVDSMRIWLTSRLWIRNAIAYHFDVDPRKVRLVPHHLAHAAQAFAGSPFESAAILTLDAVGEWTSTAIARADRRARPPIEILETIPYPHSLGLVYAAFTGFLGFTPNDAEASTMALAAFGEPTYRSQVEELIQVRDDGSYRIDASYFNFLEPDARLFTSKFVKQFGEPRDWRQPWPFDALADRLSPISSKDRRYSDIAASVQGVLEQAVVGLAERARRIADSPNLCIAGGVALNARANTRVIESRPADRVYIPPDPGDGGAAIGAAWLGYCSLAGNAAHVQVTPYEGLACEDNGFLAFCRYLADHTGAHGADESRMPKWETEHIRDPDALSLAAAEAIMEGSIVGWVQGRFEIGPRALGNRSILVDPGNLTAVRRLSQLVKGRAPFRPYALAIREEDIAKLFDFTGEIQQPARWMQMVKPVREIARPLVRGAMHVDGTTRLQVCSVGDNARFHRLLSAIAGLRGTGAVLNTSFNDPGYPIIATENEALLNFANSGLDILVVGDVILRKVQPTSPLPVSEAEPAGAR